MSINNLVCSNCEAEVQTDTDFFEHDKDENLLCENCYHHTFNEASQVLIYEHEPSKIKKWSFNSIMGLPYNEHLEVLGDGEMKMMPLNDFTRVYTNDGTWLFSDGLRGYYQHKLRDGFSMVKDGYTDRSMVQWKDVPWRHWLNHFMDDLYGNNRVHPPCDVFCVMSPIHNRHVIKTSLVVRSRDEKTFAQWLKNEYELTREELDHLLQNMAGTLKKVAPKKREKSNNNNKDNQQEQLTSYQKEMLWMKQVFEEVGLNASVIDMSGTQKTEQDKTISVTFVKRSKKS